jgi:hypothetical protein
MPTATAEYCNQREKRKMFRPSISFVAVVAAAALPAGFGGMTPRNRSLFLERGRAYVYLVYGTHTC